MSARHLACQRGRHTDLVEQVSADRKLQQDVQARDVSLCLRLSLLHFGVDELENVRVLERFVYLDLFLQLLDIRRAVAKGGGDEEVDNFAGGHAGVLVVDGPEDSNNQLVN